MVQSTHSRFCHNLSWLVTARFYDAARWSVLIQADVSAVFMVVRQIIASHAPEVKLAQRNHVIEQLPADAADKSFRDSVLPRAANAGLHWYEIA